MQPLELGRAVVRMERAVVRMEWAVLIEGG